MSVSDSRIGALFLGTVLAMSGLSALAGDSQTHLSGDQETPPVTTQASAVAAIRVYADRTISGTIKTTGIAGTVAHVHTGAIGQSGPPIVTLVKTSEGVWSVPPGRKLTEDQYRAYKAGELYVNVHSAEHPSGEIRAQLKPD
jgi:hypothetical protein